MAEILVKAVDFVNSDPVKSAVGCYKAGDIIFMADNGWSWGKEEVEPPDKGGNFFIVKVPDITIKEISDLIKERYGATVDIASPQMDLVFTSSMQKRRLFYLDVQSMTVSAKDAVSKGTLTLEWRDVAGYIKDKLNGNHL